MNSNLITTHLEFALAQLASESYLDGIDFSDQTELLRGRLLLGSNSYRIFLNPFERTLPGQSRFTDSLADRLLDQKEIIRHHANDASGFSATLMWDRAANTYTLSFRSTEYRSQNEGGDFERDRSPTAIPTPGLGANAEIFSHGFALGQLLAMQRYYQSLLASGQIPSDAKINVTGYSLGGHLATVFTELNLINVEQAYTFNSPGRGGFANVERLEGLEALEIGKMLARLDAVLYDPAAANPYEYTTSQL